MQKREIIQEVCDYFKIKTDDIQSLRREKSVANAKKVIYYVFHLFGLSYNQIGRIVNKEHSGIMHAVKTISPELKRYAIAIYDKYSGNTKILSIEEQRHLIVECLNDGCDLDQIVAKTNICKDTVTEHINFLVDRGWFKKLQNYKTGEYFYQYFEKM